jgi:putative selenium metabolism protein SsnA
MLILNGKLITWGEHNLILEGQAVAITDGVIAEIGPQDALVTKYPDTPRVDARGQLVMPGNICAHTHFYGAYARGLAIPGLPPKDFPEILERLWWPLDRSLTLEDVRYSALVNLLDAIRHGTTTLFDHHASPNALGGSLDVIASAVEESGLRSVLCYEVSDREGMEKAREGITENVRFLDIVNRTHPAEGRLAGIFGLHASLTLSDRTLAACREAVPPDVGFHIHVAEHEADEYDSLQRAGLRVVDRLSQHDILGQNTIVAHCVHVDAGEIFLLADSGTWVTHQPRSNMNNAVGAAPVESMLRAGIRVCLGTDGFQHAMWDEWKTAYLLHKVWHRDPRRMNGFDVVRVAVENNADLAARYFPAAPPGRLAPGFAADLIFVDYHPYTEISPGNLPWHILFGFNESLVTTTIVAGKLLMSERKLLTLDEEMITARARELAPAVWARYQSEAWKN